MCIFTEDVVSVGNTRILVAPLKGGRQLTVYENQAQTEKRNTMILPVPSGNITLLDIGKDFVQDGFWKICEDFFPKPMSACGFSFGGGGFGAASTKETLRVERVGGYNCSVVPTLTDLQRIDTSVFTLPKNIEAILQEHYSNFSFIICHFANQKVAGHPIACTSARLLDGRLFIPTRHEHGSSKNDGTAMQVMHKDIKCDGCQGPVVGSRWKCLICRPSDGSQSFDLCSRCYSGPAGIDHDHHPFVEFKRQMDWYFKKETNASTDGDLFDHTLYIFNAVLLSARDRYQYLDEGQARALEIGGWNASANNAFAALLGRRSYSRCQKVMIRGDYANDDYYAFPI
jgi:hypothetical protein